MKKNILITLTLIFAMLTNQPVCAAGIMPVIDEPPTGYTLYVNGEALVINNYTTSPFYKEGILMLPLRSIMENVGFEIAWNSQTKNVTMKKNDMQLSLQLGRNSYESSNESRSTLSYEPILKYSRTFVPVDFFTELVDMDVQINDYDIRLNGQQDFAFDRFDDSFIPIVADVPYDYMVDDFYGFRYELTTSPINETEAIYIQGNNHSDDMFMGFFKQLTGLMPNSEYIFKIGFDLGTNVADSMVGIGGSPGSSVYVKAGISPAEPTAELIDGKYLLKNIDKGNQSTSGKHMRQIGNIEKLSGDTSDDFEQKHFNCYFIGQTNHEGNAYLIIGTDSGFEGVTQIYYDNIQLTVREANDYNKSTLEEVDFQLEYVTRQLENGSFVYVPMATGMIQPKNEKSLNALLTDTVDGIIDNRDITNLYFSNSLTEKGILSVVFTGFEILNDSKNTFKEVLNVDMKTQSVLSMTDWIKEDAKDAFRDTVIEIASEKGYDYFEFDWDLPIFYETGFYGIIMSTIEGQQMLIIDEKQLNVFMK